MGEYPLTAQLHRSLQCVYRVGARCGRRLSASQEGYDPCESFERFSCCLHSLLPKGSPGYGTVTLVKRAAMFHAAGELTFSVDRLVAPDGTAVPVTTNAAAVHTAK
jgi:hypothetical protein